ncbi:hypothetical protein LguiB_027093 [Lonicera macranthoides]
MEMMPGYEYEYLYPVSKSTAGREFLERASFRERQLERESSRERKKQASSLYCSTASASLHGNETRTGGSRITELWHRQMLIWWASTRPLIVPYLWAIALLAIPTWNLTAMHNMLLAHAKATKLYRDHLQAISSSLALHTIIEKEEKNISKPAHGLSFLRLVKWIFSLSMKMKTQQKKCKNNSHDIVGGESMSLASTSCVVQMDDMLGENL